MTNFLLEPCCNDVSFGIATIRELYFNNIQGKLTIAEDANIRDISLTLVQSKSNLILGNDLKTGKIKAINSKSKINASGFDGCLNINSIGAKTIIDGSRLYNGHIDLNGNKKEKKIACEIISGSFELDVF